MLRRRITTKSFPAATPAGNYAHGDGGLFANPALEGGTRHPKDGRLWKRAKLAAHRRYTTTKTGAALSFAREWYERNGGSWADGLQNATVTTKPGAKYRSIQNPRMYRTLRKRGYSKEAAARITNATMPGHRVKADEAIDLKAPNYSARAGQTISGNLARGNDGKFSSAGNGFVFERAAFDQGFT